MTLAPEAMATPGVAPAGPFFSSSGPPPLAPSSSSMLVAVPPGPSHVPHMRPPGMSSGANTPSAFAGMPGMGTMDHGGDGGFFDSLLTDSLLVSQGEAGFLPNMCVRSS
jgi:hypothetical protein